MGPCRWPLAILAALGVAIAHASAYGFTEPHSGAAGHHGAGVHGYLQLCAPVVVLAAVAGMGWLIATRSGGRHRLPSTGSLASVQTLVFLAQELAEHAAAGPGAQWVLASPAVWLGLALQLLVAGTLVWFARTARRAVERLRNGRRRLRHEALRRPEAEPVGWPARWELSPQRRRGPPRPRALNLS